MRGLDISKAYYEECGRPMLEAEFPDLLPFLAVGAVGSGSDRYGYDDEVSRDHDFEPGFCIFLPGEDVVDRRAAFRLERAYAKLPKEFMGCKRQMMSPVGGNRNGVIRSAEFYEKTVGTPDGNLSTDAWLRLPDYALAEATNGEVFFDDYGEFTAIRLQLSEMPADIRLKRLAGNLLLMAQAGQYNYIRCLKHGEREAAQLAAVEFVRATMKVLFLLHHRYMPYYKWSFRALREIAPEMTEKLSFLLYGDATDAVAEEKYTVIEEIATAVISSLMEQGLTKAICGDLEKHAYSVNDRVSDANLRNLPVLAAV